METGGDSRYDRATLLRVSRIKGFEGVPLTQISEQLSYKFDCVTRRKVTSSFRGEGEPGVPGQRYFKRHNLDRDDKKLRPFARARRIHRRILRSVGEI